MPTTARKAILVFLLSITISTFVAPAAQGQIQQQALVTKLKGIDAVSEITIGDQGSPAGFNVPYAVNTLVYPDGQVTYRVEWAMVRGEVTQMQKSFGSGTTFQISSVDFKDDRMELKLIARSRDSGRLKVMFGANWQSRMSNADVFQVLSKFLTLPSAPAEGGLETGIVASSPATQKPTSVSVSALYTRPSNAVSIPGRYADSVVKPVLAELQQRKQTEEDNLQLAASRFSSAFRAFTVAFGQRRAHALPEIAELRNRLGNSFIPRTSSDIDDIQKTFGDCVRTDAMAGGVGFGSNVPGYQQAFPGGDVGTLQQHSTDAMRAAFSEITAIDEGEKLIIDTEQDLDEGNLVGATRHYAALVNGNTAQLTELVQYISVSKNLQSDISTYLKASSRTTDINASPVKLVQDIAKESYDLASADGRPITFAYLQKQVVADKSVLQAKLNGLAAFVFDPRLDTITTSTAAKVSPIHDDGQLANKLSQLENLLSNASDLIGLTNNSTAMGLIRSWYGETALTSLAEKAKNVPEAEAMQNKLENQIANDERIRREEAAARQSLAEKRDSLASEIVNHVLIVTKLEEQFRQTEIMGYSMEERKNRDELDTLIRSNRSLLDGATWAQVHRNFQDLMPGLTVWEVTYAQNILNVIQR